MTIIIPIHEINDTVKTYLMNALASVERQKDASSLKVIIVFPDKLHENGIAEYLMGEMGKYSFTITPVANTGNFDFQSQINFAVADPNMTSDYFSILEFDDEYSEIYFKNVDKYIQAYPNVDVFLPITIQVDKNGRALSLINDAAWSRDFVGEDGEQGFLSIDALKKYSQFSLTGGVFKTSSFKTIGQFKKNLKLTFGYEFLLRVLNVDMKVMAIAKVGYKHVVDRDNSLFINYTASMNMKERRFWFDAAAKEYYFTQDREIDITPLSAQ
jgi:hypothetical protein